jgi:hypothetical protein
MMLERAIRMASAFSDALGPLMARTAPAVSVFN